MIATDWKIYESREDGKRPQADGGVKIDYVWNVYLRTVDVDLDSEGTPRDFGCELIDGTYEGPEDDWPKVKRTIEAAPNMLTCLKMLLASRPNAMDYAKKLVEFVEGPQTREAQLDALRAAGFNVGPAITSIEQLKALPVAEPSPLESSPDSAGEWSVDAQMAERAFEAEAKLEGSRVVMKVNTPEQDALNEQLRNRRLK